ncbi:MAG: biopolymer transporter ExbD [Rhodoferax sp.]|nr:biopolymer transporter ExbD [Rhodoferax sp.]
MMMPMRTPDLAEPELLMEINTTPLIDVMLVLLVMLIITIPIQLHAVNLQFPVAVPAAAVVRPTTVQIDIDAAGTVTWDGIALSQAAVEEKMAAIATLPTQPEVHLRAHKDAQYAVFAGVLAGSRRAGVTTMVVVGSEQFIK